MRVKLWDPLAYAYSDFGRARVYCYCMFFGAAITFFLGCIAAYALHYPEAINRAGGLITTLSLILVLGQFQFENKHKGEVEKIEKRVANIAVDRQYPADFSKEVVDSAKAGADDRIERTRYAILTSSVALGAFGEIVHAVGDLLFETIISITTG